MFPDTRASSRAVWDKQRSMSGYCFYVLGCLLSWKRKLQPTTADSTHAAELITASSRQTRPCG